VVIIAVGLAALVLLSAGLISDLHVRSELHKSDTSISALRGRLVTTMRKLSAAEGVLSRTSGERETLEVALKLTAWELGNAEARLASTESSLASAQAGLASSQAGLANADANLALQGASITALNTCLGGVERALNQISVTDQQGAVSSLSAVSESCQAIQGQGQGGPRFPFDFPDPDVVRLGASYFGYATNSATGNVQMIESSDLVRWTVLGDALPHLPSWARAGGTWAPGVFTLNGSDLLYYAAIDQSTGKECISEAVAAQPQGPFVDSSGAPLVCQVDQGGSIDPSPFVDATGTPYLTWKTIGGNGHPATIWSQQLSADGGALVGPGPTALLQPTQRWEGSVVEGPFMLPWFGHYYLFYSANDWNTADYAIGVATCQGPTGPCSKPFDHAIVASDGSLVGPGGPSLVADPQGGLWIAFHGWLPSAVGYPHSRLLFIRPVSFVNQLPVVGNS
jgi:hypothetical protein